MLRRRTFVLAAAVGLLAVPGAGAGAESPNRLPYDVVLASYTVGNGTSVFVSAWRAADGGRTYGRIRVGLNPPSRACILVERNEAFVMGEVPDAFPGSTLVFSLLLRDNFGTGKPDEFNGIHPPHQGNLPRVCPPFDGFGKGLNGIPVSSGDINIHDG